MRRIGPVCALALTALLLPGLLSAYPIDGYPQTGIRRLLRLERIAAGKIPGRLPPPGGRLPLSEVRLNLMDPAGQAMESFPPSDPALQKRLDALFPDRDASYAVAVLDITPGRPPRYASRKADRAYSPGSVGKLAIAAGLFRELKRLFPEDPEKRRELLRTRRVTADRFIHSDHHNVPVYDPDTGAYASRPIREGDVFSLYEWTDHMLSASANAAASTVWKEAMLMRQFGAAYPPNPEQEKAFFEKTPRNDLRDMAMSVVNDPLREAGIPQAAWQLGSFFTSAGKRIVPPGGKSYATPEGLLTYLKNLEQGRIVDGWSSLEIKRLMYMTAWRIRYASSPALSGAAVYFKSGSQYRCKPEPEFQCAKYMGNVENYMNSVVIVEHPGGARYMVALMSNVLRKNSAVEHQSLATFIDRILTRP